MRVLVAMSGGVDSSTAAALLTEAGNEVFGVSMRVADYSDPRRGRSCCAPDDLDDARRVARHLSIPFYVANVEARFKEKVIDRFVDDYVSGRTPNPCISCNVELKFGWLLARARAVDARLATGHYARVERRDGRFALLVAADRGKDQSYFLYGLGQDELRDLVFPVGHLNKTEVRAVAARAGLPTADKAESQEICFVTDGNAAHFVSLHAKGRLRQGEIVASDGEVLGHHDGVHQFTVGQRKGLGITGPFPRFVSRIEAETGRVVVGTAAEASRERFCVEETRWVRGTHPSQPLDVLVKVRHRHEGERAIVRAGAGDAEVRLERPVRGVAPGQAAVFYVGDEVVGGGRIV